MLLHCSPLLKKTSVRQVVLDKWFPLINITRLSVTCGLTHVQCVLLSSTLRAVIYIHVSVLSLSLNNLYVDRVRRPSGAIVRSAPPTAVRALERKRVHMAHSQLGSFLIGLVSNRARC